MNKLLTLCLLAAAIAGAQQTTFGQPNPPVPAVPQPGDTAEQIALKEAHNLSRKVVELYNEDKFDEALPLAEKVLTLREGVLPANDRRIADALANIASLRFAKEETDTAEKLYRRALAIYEAAGDGDAPVVVTLLNRLLLVTATKRDFNKAEVLAQRLVSIAEKKYKPDQLEMAMPLINLAEVYRLKLDNKRARTLYAQVVDIVEKFSPAAVPKDITRSLSNYLNLLYLQEGGKDSDLTGRINKLFVAIAASRPPGAEQPIQGGVLNGKAVYKPQPEYPAGAKSARAQGIVTVQVTVDESGKVIYAKAINKVAHITLALASEDAARQARFTPTLLDGKPVKVNGIITYRFILQ